MRLRVSAATIMTQKEFFDKLDKLYAKLKTWEAVADYTGFKLRSIQRWRMDQNTPDINLYWMHYVKIPA